MLKTAITVAVAFMVLVSGPVLAAEKEITIGEYLKIYDEGSPALKEKLENSTATSGRTIFVVNEYLKLVGQPPLFCPPKEGLNNSDYFAAFQITARLPDSVELPAIGRTAILLTGLIYNFPCKK